LGILNINNARPGKGKSGGLLLVEVGLVVLGVAQRSVVRQLARGQRASEVGWFVGVVTLLLLLLFKFSSSGRGKSDSHER
jgi:hypothetical protein